MLDNACTQLGFTTSRLQSLQVLLMTALHLLSMTNMMFAMLMYQPHLHLQAQHLTDTMLAADVGSLCFGAQPAPCARQANFGWLLL